MLLRTRTPTFPHREIQDSLTAIEHWNRGELSEVIDKAGVQLEKYPLDTTALALRGFAQFHQAINIREIEEREAMLVAAIQDMRRLLILSEKSLKKETHYVLGKAYYHRGKYFYDLAIQELQTAWELGMQNLDILEYFSRFQSRAWICGRCNTILISGSCH